MALEKQSISSALQAYSSEINLTSASSWQRPQRMAEFAVRFEWIAGHLTGMQPNLRLECVCVIEIISSTRPLMIAVDVTDGHQVWLVEALQARGFYWRRSRHIRGKISHRSSTDSAGLIWC